VKVFSKSIKKQEKVPRKVYCIDCGLPNVVGLRFSENIGRLAENLVFLELIQEHFKNPLVEVYYWKDYSGREVDFVVKSGLEVKQLIQVCWNVEDEKTKEREVTALLKAMDEFKLKEGLVITEDYEDKEARNEKIITYKPLWKWLLGEKI
jgi:predicted AAA+ superfamily ATPase